MSKIVQVQAAGDFVWTLREGVLTAWVVRADGNLVPLSGAPLRDAYESLPDDF